MAGNPGHSPSARDDEVMTTHELRIKGQRVLVVRSPRRRKTISANWQDGAIRLQIPATLTSTEENYWAERMVEKLRKRRNAGTLTDEQLLSLALRLNDKYFAGEATPTSVEFSPRQNTLWGSCSTLSRRIRLNADLATMPEYVLIGVLVHELAHILEPNHGPRFRALEGRYERLAEANAFLAGVTHGRNIETVPPAQNGSGNGLDQDDVFDD